MKKGWRMMALFLPLLEDEFWKTAGSVEKLEQEELESKECILSDVHRTINQTVYKNTE